MHTHRAAALGILYAEDFAAAAPPPLAPELPPSPVPLIQADIDAACHRAVALARVEWTNADEARRTVALETLAAGLAEARAAADETAEATADAIARTVLSMLAGALPDLCRAHGDAEVRALLLAMLPLLAASRPVMVRVHAGAIEALRHDLAGLCEDTAARIEFRPADLPPGDARLSWEDGSLVRDGAAICAALTDALSRLGLIDHATFTLQTGAHALAQ